MGLRDFALRHGIIESDADSAVQSNSPLESAHRGVPQTAAKPSVAELLTQRRVAMAETPRDTRTQVALASAAPQSAKPKEVRADPGIVEHFHGVANRSTMSGFTEFVTQVRVLGKHIRDEGALYAAVLDSIQGSDSINREAVIRAIEDRITLVRTEKEGGVAALEAQKKDDLSANQARVAEIASAIEQLEREIAERRRQIDDLMLEDTKCQNALAAAGAEYDADKTKISVAGDQVINELESQAAKLRSL